MPHALSLVATYPESEGREATAALGTDPGNPQVYEVGSILSNGAVIEEIHADRIVLSRNGKRATLLANLQAVPREEAIVVGGADDLQAVDTVPTSGEQLSRYLRPQLVFEGNQLVGLKIVAGLQPEGLDILGLVEGDIVRGVEGKSVTVDSDWEPIAHALNSGKSISVLIERNGSLVTWSLDGSRLAKAAESTGTGVAFSPLGS